jgi:hypothetical protein
MALPAREPAMTRIRLAGLLIEVSGHIGASI